MTQEQLTPENKISFEIVFTDILKTFRELMSNLLPMTNDLKKQITEYRSKRQNIIQESTKKRVQASAEFSQKIKPILGDYAAENNISIIEWPKKLIKYKEI